MTQWTQWGAVDPELAAYLTLLEPVDPDDLAGHRLMQRKQWAAATAEPDRRVTVGMLEDQSDVAAPPVRLRTYWCDEAGPFAPALVWLHGGAFAVGFCEIDDDLCSWLAGEVGCHILVPEYRLAPEHPYPAGFQDAYDTLTWVAANAVALGIDRRRIAVGGASAGGALAAAVCLRARDDGGPAIAFQLLVYPVTDDRLDTPSMRMFTDSPVFDARAAELMWQRYLGPARPAAPPYAAPMRADSLRGLPPTYLLTTHLDPLRDEGLAYGLRLIADGVETELHHVPQAFHGFDTVAPTAGLSQRVWRDYAAALRRALAP